MKINIVLIISLLYLMPAWAREFATKHVRIKPAQNTPKIDGVLNENEWAGAVASGNFVKTNGAIGSEANYATSAHLSYDAEYLYIAVVCREPDMAGLKTKAFHHDDPLIYFDDRVEIFIDAQHRHRQYFNFVVNAAGKTADRSIFQYLSGVRTHHPDPQWAGRWFAKTQKGANQWTTEIAIDWKTLGLNPAEIPTLGFNIGRARKPTAQYGDKLRELRVKGEEEFSAWSLTQDGIWETTSNFYESLQFGDLTVGDTDLEIQSLQFDQINYNGDASKPTKFGFNTVELSLKEIQKDGKILTVNLYQPQKGTEFDRDFTRNLTYSKTFPIVEGKVTGEYFIHAPHENLLEIKIHNSKGELLYNTSYMLMAIPMVSYNLEGFYSTQSTNTHNIDLKINALPKTLTNATIEIVLKNENQKVISKKQFQSLSAAQSITLFKINELKNILGGNYTLIANFKNGKQAATFSQTFTKPQFIQPKILKAEQKPYQYGGYSGTAVVVEFPNQAARFVFWEKASYIPWWDIDQAIFSNEFVESWDNGIEGCGEPMQDRENKFSSVEILENTPVRVRVRWRYALNDAHYQIHGNEWVDEIFTFYPDATGMREVILTANTNKDHEVFETIFVIPPGITTTQLLEEKVVTLKNFKGKELSIKAFTQDPSIHKEFIIENQDFIIESHFKDRKHPFVGVSTAQEYIPYTNMPELDVAKQMVGESFSRGHWPVSIYPVDGYNTIGFSRPGHYSLGNIHMMTHAEESPQRYYFLQGLKDKDSDFDLKVTENWLHPALLKSINGDIKVEYNKALKLHEITVGNQKQAIFSPDKNLYNPAFSIKNNNKGVFNVKINGVVEKDIKWSVSGGETILFISKTIMANDTILIELL